MRPSSLLHALTFTFLGAAACATQSVGPQASNAWSPELADNASSGGEGFYAVAPEPETAPIALIDRLRRVDPTSNALAVLRVQHPFVHSVLLPRALRGLPHGLTDGLTDATASCQVPLLDRTDEAIVAVDTQTRGLGQVTLFGDFSAQDVRNCLQFSDRRLWTSLPLSGSVIGYRLVGDTRSTVFVFGDGFLTGGYMESVQRGILSNAGRAESLAQYEPVRAAWSDLDRSVAASLLVLAPRGTDAMRSLLRADGAVPEAWMMTEATRIDAATRVIQYDLRTQGAELANRVSIRWADDAPEADLARRTAVLMRRAVDGGNSVLATLVNHAVVYPGDDRVVFETPARQETMAALWLRGDQGETGAAVASANGLPAPSGFDQTLDSFFRQRVEQYRNNRRAR